MLVIFYNGFDFIFMEYFYINVILIYFNYNCNDLMFVIVIEFKNSKIIGIILIEMFIVLLFYFF